MGRLILAAALALRGGAALAGCGPDPEPCTLDGGSYHIALPEPGAAAGPVPVVMFLHGYGGDGAGVIRNPAVGDALTARGYAVIAPDGTIREGGSRRSWVFAPFWAGRDENAFFAAVLADAAARFGTSASQTVLAGFSSGAFMVTYQACRHPESFAAFAPVSGGFWRPLPEACAGPVRLYHSHGWDDGMVPLEGRFLGGGRFQQGDVFAGLELFRAAGGCAGHAPAAAWSEDGVLLRRWECGAGADIGLALYPGGHRVTPDWAARMTAWFEGSAGE